MPPLSASNGKVWTRFVVPKVVPLVTRSAFGRRVCEAMGGGRGFISEHLGLPSPIA